MAIETLLWIGGLLIEVLIVAAIVLFVLLRRAQKARDTQPVAAAAIPVPPPAPPAVAAEPVVAIEIATNDWVEGGTGAPNDADNAKLSESADRLQQQMNVTNESLQRLEVDLKQDPTGAGAAHLAALKGNLQDMHSEIDSLQKSGAKLRQDMSAMRDKLRHSEADLQTLQKEKEQLAAEYTALSAEYERVYANSAK